ncbi:hypothetical protein BCV69DRAFT_282729 [Microstroma glucosiphilum]|uniref:Uncharacterized protein n=1 Tax=Pseudomicrostroma glucosiphilum TaxID=1684307 RepID=A0A316U9Z9_9BASI|nr:hypothetical protein BCV69DRAFT_282729 [Pseudomicrostroma glucosiphilum]PWN21233.1 hypothetical protein BCV69DRAFT_282729 [Pseudomicrostroma glucosiphilum]
MEAVSPPPPSPSRVPRSASPPSSQVVDAHHEPLNRLAQVSKMIQKAKEGVLLEASPPPALPSTSSRTDGQKDHSAHSDNAEGSRVGLLHPHHTASTSEEGLVTLGFINRGAEMTAPRTTSRAALPTSANSLPQVHWGFGSRSAATAQDSRLPELSACGKDPLLPTEKQQATASSIKFDAPGFADPASGEPLLQSLSAAAPEAEVDAIPNASSPFASSCVSALLDKEPETTSPDMFEPPSATNGCVKSPSTDGNASGPNIRRHTGGTPGDRPSWGSFGLSVLESQDSVPVWDALPRQPTVPFTPSAGADASSVALSDSQTQSQSNASQAASESAFGNPRAQADLTADILTVPLTQRATYVLRPDGVAPSHDQMDEDDSPVYGPVQAHTKNTPTPLSQLFTPAQRADDAHDERLQRSPTFTASAETPGKDNPLRWIAAGAIASSVDMSQASASDASDHEGSAASSSPVPRVEAGWSVAVNPGGSWEDQGKSTSSRKPSPVEDIHQALPPGVSMVDVDESLPFLLNSPAPSLPGDGDKASLPQDAGAVGLLPASARTQAGLQHGDVDAVFEDGPSHGEQETAKELFDTADETFSLQRRQQDMSIDEDALEVERSTQTADSLSQSPDRDQHDNARASEQPMASHSADSTHKNSFGDPSAAVWRAAEIRPPILDDSRRRSELASGIPCRRRPAVRQIIQIMLPPAPKRRGTSTLVYDGRVPGSVRKDSAWQQRSSSTPRLASDSDEGSEEPVASTSTLSLKTPHTAGQIKVTSAPGKSASYTPSKSTLSVNKQGLGKDRQSRLVFSKARVEEEDESWRPKSALPVPIRRKRGRPRTDKHKHKTGRQTISSGSDEASTTLRSSRRQTYHALPSRSSREHARALTRSIIQEQESESDEELPRSTGQRSQTIRRPPQQILLEEEDDSQRRSAAEVPAQLNNSASSRRPSSPDTANPADQASVEGIVEEQSIQDSGDESSAPILLGVRQTERDVPSHTETETPIEITSSGSAKGANEVIEISEDSVILSQPAVASSQVAVRANAVTHAQVSSAAAVAGPPSPRHQKLAAVAVPAKQAPRLLSVQPGISTLEALKRMRHNAGSTELSTGNNSNESSATESGESMVQAAATADGPQASRADLDEDYRLLCEDQEEIRQEQAWLAEQRRSAQAAGGRYEENADDSWDTSADHSAETEADSWAEPRPHRGERSIEQAGRGQKELRPLGKFVGELLQHAQTAGERRPPILAKQATRSGQLSAVPAPALLRSPAKRPATSTSAPVLATATDRKPAPASGRDVTEGQKRKAVSPVGRELNTDDGSPASKRPRVDREEGRRRLARLLKAIGD